MGWEVLSEINEISEINSRKTNTVWFHIYVESRKQSKWTNMKKQKQNYRYREQMVDRGEGGGGKKVIDEGDQEVQTSTCKINKSQVWDVQYEKQPTIV